MEPEILGPPHLTKPYQSLNIIISSGRAKEFLGRDITLKQLDSMGDDSLDAYYKIYELNYANKIGENIVSSIIGLYSSVVNKVLPIDDVNQLQRDLRDDYILTNELKNLTGGIAASWGKIMSLFTLSFITLKHTKFNLGGNKELSKELSNTEKEL